MDYVTRQFINLTKKFRKESRLLLTRVASALEKQAEAISESTDAANRRQSTPPQVAVQNNLPGSVEIHQNIRDARNEQNYKRALFFMTALSFAGFAVYAVIVYWQWQQMIVATNAAKESADAAKQQADISRDTLLSVQRAFVIFHANIDMDFITLDYKPYLWRLRVPMENTGVTPAISLKDRISWTNPVGELPDNYAFPDLKGEHGQEGAKHSAETIAPKEIIWTPVVSIKSPVIEEVIKQNQPRLAGIPTSVNGGVSLDRGNTRRLYVYGWATYRDIFDKTPDHLTEFCMMLALFKGPTPSDPKAGAEWSYCPHHNCIDKQCSDYDAKVKEP